MSHAFVSNRVVTPGGTRPAALLVEGERIRAISNPSEVPADATLHDCGHLAILPGLVDTHVHINQPGRTEWEGFPTATRAAAAGGITTVVDMPLNCLPATTTVAALEAKRESARGQCFIDWAPWGGAVADNRRDILPLARAGVLGYKCFLIHPGCEGFTMIDHRQLEATLPHIARSGLPLLVHAELAGPIDRATESLKGADWCRYSTYLASRPDEAELEAIRMMIGLCRRYRFRLHIVHLSTALALDDLRSARAEGLPITVETCPHYLHFTAEEIPDSSAVHKCAPPIRGRENREALWQALGAGDIDMIVTDHSPCPPAMKCADRGSSDTARFDEAWGGIASLSLALSIIHTECRARGFTLDHMVRWMSAAPAALAGLGHRTGALEPGREATFVLFDTDAELKVTPDHLYFHHPISPYLGETLRGEVRATWLRGEPIFSEGTFMPTPTGREIISL